MLEVYTWEPNANSGKPLFCRKEKGASLTFHFIDMGAREHFWTRSSPSTLREPSRLCP
jgi:glutathione S-transferase/GST-like protein